MISVSAEKVDVSRALACMGFVTAAVLCDSVSVSTVKVFKQQPKVLVICIYFCVFLKNSNIMRTISDLTLFLLEM